MERDTDVVDSLDSVVIDTLDSVVIESLDSVVNSLDVAVDNPVDVVVVAVSSPFSKYVVLTSEDDENKSNRVRTIDAFSFVPVLIMDYYTYACNFVLLLLYKLR